MHDCPHCGEVLDLSKDDRGSRRADGACIVRVELGSDLQLVATCRHCKESVTVTADIVRVEDG